MLSGGNTTWLVAVWTGSDGQGVQRTGKDRLGEGCLQRDHLSMRGDFGGNTSWHAGDRKGMFGRGRVRSGETGLGEVGQGLLTAL